MNNLKFVYLSLFLTLEIFSGCATGRVQYAPNSRGLASGQLPANTVAKYSFSGKTLSFFIPEENFRIRNASKGAGEWSAVLLYGFSTPTFDHNRILRVHDNVRKRIKNLKVDPAGTITIPQQIIEMPVNDSDLNADHAEPKPHLFVAFKSPDGKLSNVTINLLSDYSVTQTDWTVFAVPRFEIPVSIVRNISTNDWMALTYNHYEKLVIEAYANWGLTGRDDFYYPMSSYGSDVATPISNDDFEFNGVGHSCSLKGKFSSLNSVGKTSILFSPAYCLVPTKIIDPNLPEPILSVLVYGYNSKVDDEGHEQINGFEDRYGQKCPIGFNLPNDNYNRSQPFKCAPLSSIRGNKWTAGTLKLQ